MKSIALFLLFVAFSLLVRSQTWNSSCTPTGNMVSTYKTDAYKLAIGRLKQINSPWKDSIDVPQLYQDSIAKALYAIENMAWTPLKDTIMNMFGFRNFDTATSYSFELDSSHIHSVGFSGNSFSSIFVKKIRVQPLGGSALAAQWSAGNYYNTSNTALNTILSRYNIAVNNGILSFKRALNASALAAKIAAMPDIYFAETVPIIGDGNYIQATYENDGIHLEYRNGCGDCPSGCTYSTHWLFKVFYNSCNVQYLGRSPIVDGETAFQRVCSRGTVMAITSIDIHASIKNNLPVVDWKITADENTQKFIIERSTDGKNFMAAASIAADKNSSLSHYSWIDQHPFSNINYYRVKSIGLTGKIIYSSIVKVKMDINSPSMVVYPNPAKDYIYLQCNKFLTGKVIIEIADASGKIALQRTVYINSNIISIATNKLPPGTYIVSVINNTDVFRQLVVLVK